MNPYTVHDSSFSVSQMRQELNQVLKNKGLTEEDIAHFNDVLGVDNVMLLGDLTEHDLFPGNTPVSDVDLSFLSGKKRCQLLRLVYLTQELRRTEYSWLTDAEKYQLFLRGDVNFITMGEQETLEKLMREVQHRATRWLATNISRAELEEWEELEL
jgi:hypothetical protein